MLDCKHATQLASQAMEGRLPLRQRIALRFHLLLCDACTNFVKQLQLLRSALLQLRHTAENAPDVMLSKQARERIAEAVAHQAHQLDEARRNPDQHSTD